MMQRGGAAQPAAMEDPSDESCVFKEDLENSTRESSMMMATRRGSFGEHAPPEEPMGLKLPPDFTVATVTGKFHLSPAPRGSCAGSASAQLRGSLGVDRASSTSVSAEGASGLAFPCHSSTASESNLVERQLLDVQGGLLCDQINLHDAAGPYSGPQYNGELHRSSSSEDFSEGEKDCRPDSSSASADPQHVDPQSAPMSRSMEESGSDSDNDEESFVDEFGFILDEESKHREDVYIKNVDGCKLLRAEVKWASIAAQWTEHRERKHKFIKRRCRKGIPGRFRGVAWQLLLQSRQLMNKAESAGIYDALRDKVLSQRAQEYDEIISRDLDRTFPRHVLFRQKDGSGQRFLRNVLHAYAAADPEVGYVQGMGFVVCALSTQLGEEETFWALHMLMHQEPWKLRELYRPDFPMLHQFFFQLKRLMAKLVPRVYKRFEELMIEPSFYASQWFLTIFVGVLPFRALLRVWDIFLNEGWKIIFRMAIALLKWDEAQLLSMPYDNLLLTLKSGLHETKDSDKLVKRALSVKFTTATLNQYKAEYWAQKPHLETV